MVGEESHTSYIIPTTPTMRQFVSGYLYLPAMGDVNLAVSDRSIGKIASMTQLYSIFACLCVADVKCAPLQSDRSMSKHYQFKLHDSTTKEIGPSPSAPHRQLFHHFHALVALRYWSYFLVLNMGFSGFCLRYCSAIASPPAFPNLSSCSYGLCLPRLCSDTTGQ